MTTFTADIVVHREGLALRYLAVTTKARDLFRVLPKTLGVPCVGAYWDGAALVAPSSEEPRVVDRLAGLGLSVGEVLPGSEDW